MRMTAEIVGKSGRRRGRQRDEDEEERGKNIFLKMKRCNWCDLVSSRKPTAESAKERCRLNVHSAYDFVM